MHVRSLLLLVLSALALAVVVPRARAQSAEAVSSFTEGSTDDDSENDTRFSLTGGATLAYGNARTLGVNVAGSFFFREDDEQLVIEVGYILGMSEAPLTCAADPEGVGCGGMPSGARTGGFAGTWVENANNLTWRLRYDHFLDPDNAIFVAHRGRRDPFAGLEIRMGFQLGYSRVLLRDPNHRLTLDLGIDGTADHYTLPVRDVNRAGAAAVPPTFDPPIFQGTDGRFIPAVRVNLAYENHLVETLTYDTNLEVLWNVVNPGHFLIEWQNHVRSRITGFLQLSLDVILRIDSQPPGQRSPWTENAGIVGTDGRVRPGQVTQMWDLLTTINLVGTFDLDGAPEAVEEAPCPEPAPCAVCPPPAGEATTDDASPAADDASPATAPAPEREPEPAAAPDAEAPAG